MVHIPWQAKFGVGLVAMSALLYATHIAIFGDVEHVNFFLLEDLVFLPVSALFVTLFIDRMLRERERQERLEKMNMVIGVFFSEVGTDLIRLFSKCDPGADRIRDELAISAEWSHEEFDAMVERFRGYDYVVRVRCSNLTELRKFLLKNRGFMLSLLENQNLLEHEDFTDLLRAVFHLTEELEYRNNLKSLHEKDLEHLGGDMRRVYSLILIQWLRYMQHLKPNYPYLFSLAIRMNPLKKDCKAEVC